MDLDEIVNYLYDLKAKNKSIIGTFPHQMIPLELINSFDASPLVLNIAGTEEICSLGTDYLTPATCPFARSSVGYLEAKNEIYSKIDALIGLNYCNGDLCAVDYINRYFNIPQIQFAFPTIISENSEKFFRAQVLDLKSNLENFLNKRFSMDQLSNSIKIFNKVRSELQIIAKIVGMGSIFQEIIHKLYIRGPEACLTAINDIKQKNEPINENSGKILFLGSFVGIGDKILSIIEENNLSVVKNQSESIFYFEKEVQDNDPLNNLADFYFYNNNSFRMINSQSKVDKIIEYHAKGEFEAIVFHVLKFCDIYVAEIAKFKNVMAENNIPTLILERDYAENLGQLSTRVEAFREIII